ncbi:MAG: hypothetical protein IIU86_03090, partial [Oscillospiraceae bacterium]|nr:hypothetical protein [Oscillospiraceae bacterium]
SSFLTIRRCQLNTNSVLVDLEPQTALLVIIGLLAQFRVLGGIGKQSFYAWYRGCRPLRRVNSCVKELIKFYH